MRSNSYVKIFIILLLLFIISEFLIIFLGYGKVAYFIIFPIFYSSNAISLIPLIFIFLMFFIPFMVLSKGSNDAEKENWYYQDNTIEKTEKSEDSSFAGFIFIGPLPIVFGKNIDKKIVYLMILLFAVFVFIYLLIFLNL